MKKFGIYCAALLAVGFTACDDKSDLGTPQVNPQEPVMEAAGITVAYQGGFAGKAINLEAAGKDAVLPVLTYTTAEGYELPEGAYTEFRMEMASTQDFSDAKSFNLVNNEGVYSATVADLDAVYTSLYGLDPTPAQPWVRVAGYIVNGTELVRIGNESTYFGAEQITVTPIDVKYDIESEYFVTAGGTTGGTPMLHSDKHPYTDPNFSIALKVTDADLANGAYKWLVVPKSQVDAATTDGCYGVAANEEAGALEGKLVKGGIAGEIHDAGDYLLTVNMLTLEYKVMYTNEQLWVVGAYCGNKWNEGQVVRLTTMDNINYAGYMPITGPYMLSGDWNYQGLQVRYAEEGKIVLKKTGKPFTLPATGKGGYYAKVNLADLTYSNVYIETLGIVGGFNGWGADPDIALTPNANYTVWEGDFTLPEAGEWKIRANSDWAISFGGTFENTYFDGGNFNSQPGTYHVVIDFTTCPYTTTVTEK
ncbi:MAG: hypothetical protein K2O24_08845 [Muribaculaceae bacterium]|nr:hypothetical protein [Muribaculaceae bacterium]